MGKQKYLLLPVVCCLLLITGCGEAVKKKKTETKESTTATKGFTMPEIPKMLTTAEQRAEYVVKHYWDTFNFADTSLISRAEVTEQAFADFVNILINLPVELRRTGVDIMMSKADVDRRMYSHFMTMAEKYLYDPNSPMRNEDTYILILESFVANSNVDELEKVRPQYQLDLALKNRIGDKALDFTYSTEDGKKSTMYKTKADLLLLFFFNPGCETCKGIMEYTVEKGIDKKVKVLYISQEHNQHLDSIYDLRASPTLYLLDKDKTVLLKDPHIGQVEEYVNSLK